MVVPNEMDQFMFAEKNVEALMEESFTNNDPLLPPTRN